MKEKKEKKLLETHGQSPARRSRTPSEASAKVDKRELVDLNDAEKFDDSVTFADPIGVLKANLPVIRRDSVPVSADAKVAKMPKGEASDNKKSGKKGIFWLFKKEVKDEVIDSQKEG